MKQLRTKSVNWTRAALTLLFVLLTTAGAQAVEKSATDMQADYNRALKAIVDGKAYRVFTMVDGVKYYVTGEGKLSTNVDDAPLFSFTKVAPKSADGDGEYENGFQIKNGSYYFTNSSEEDGSALNEGHLCTTNKNKRTTWEAQVFFLNTEGKFAVRSTNAKSGDTGWAKVGTAFWTVDSSDNGPVAEYSYDMNYVWELEDELVGNYEWALKTIKDGKRYRVFTMVGTQKYYVTADGELSTNVDDAPLFSFNKVAPKANDGDGEDDYGFQIKNGSYYFTNSSKEDGSALKEGHICVTNKNSRTTWEAQVFFLNSEGKYAVRSTNAKSGDTGWAQVGTAFWTVYSSDNGAVAVYSYDMNYVWQIEGESDSHTHELVKVDEVSPTCTESGSDAYWKCSICGKKFSDENGKNETNPTEIPPLGHIWGDWVVISEATPETPGVKQRTCERDHSHVETEEIEFSTDNLPIPEGAIDIAQLTSDYTAQDGDVLAGRLSNNVKISIADGATVTLSNMTIIGVSTFSLYGDALYEWAGINCEGNATIILEGINTVKGFFTSYPGIHVPKDKTLTIKGDGSLYASSNGNGAGIGGGLDLDCGNIVIEGGTISAVGGQYAAAIGGGECYKITNVYCGDITITDGVTRVTAKSDYSYAIGAGYSSLCGTVTIGGVVTGSIHEHEYTYNPNEGLVNLQDLTSDYVAKRGDILTGMLMADVRIKIEDGATVTLRNAKINTQNSDDFQWEGIACLGNATIVLEGENAVVGSQNCAGIYVPKDKRLTIKGNGSLSASNRGGNAAGIGAQDSMPGGNITIQGGSVSAVGGTGAAGIGGAGSASCGDILIYGGEVYAVGGQYAPGIGSGWNGSCGAVTVSVNTYPYDVSSTRVVAKSGSSEAEPLGAGLGGSCGSVKIDSIITDVTNNDTRTLTSYVYYPVKVGMTFVNSNNMNDVLGDGSVSYTPGENGAGTLTFTTKTLKIEDSYYLIQAYKDLTINTDGELSLETETGEWGIYTNAGLTINGNIKITGPCTGLVAAGGNLTVNGDVDVTNTADIGGNWLLYATGDMNISGNVTVTTQNPSDYAKSIECSRSITIGGDLTINNAGYYGLSAGLSARNGGLTVKGSVKGYAKTIGLGVYAGNLNIAGDIDFYVTSNSGGCIQCHYNVYIDGNAKLKCLNGANYCISVDKDITIGGNAEMSGGYGGISGYTSLTNITFVSGRWDISGSNYSIYAKSLTIPEP